MSLETSRKHYLLSRVDADVNKAMSPFFSIGQAPLHLSLTNFLDAFKAKKKCGSSQMRKACFNDTEKYLDLGQ